MNKNLIIRSDANARIGTGHVMRCLTLADGLQRCGAEVIFVCREFNGNLCDYIEKKGYVVHRLPVSDAPGQGRQCVGPDLKHAAWLGTDWQADAGQVEEIIKGIECPPDWLIVDHYALDERWEGYLRPYVKKVMVLDDLADRPHDCNLLLDQNFHLNLESRYDRLVSPQCKKLLGPNYALLRPEFLKWREWKREIPAVANKILVTLGGGDPDNVTLKVIKALNDVDIPDIEVKIVIGPVNPNIESLKKEIHCAPFTSHLLTNVSDMTELMAWADVVVSAGGSTCWELAFMGVPSLIVTIADNQAGIAEGLGKAGVSIDLGWHENISIKQYAQKLKEILQDKSKRACLSKQGQKLVNGRGRQKIIRAMHAWQVKLRRVQENDCELLWKWANDPEARQAAFNSKNITWEDHQTWFLNKQNDPDCFQYIALKRHNVPIGQIRFDIKNSIADIDYSIDKNFRGIKLEKVLLKKGCELFSADVERPITIQGLVLKENEPSNRAFQDAGFLKADEKTIDENDITNTHTHHLSITILSDKEGWINKYMPNLISELVLSGHTVDWGHNILQIKNGDIVFYLGCGQIVPANVLSRNKHNLVVHESALPHGKGWSPLTWQIIEGKNEIPITLFEAVEKVDDGTIYLTSLMKFQGTELVDELREVQAESSIRMCLQFVEEYPDIVVNGIAQAGESIYYPRRSPDDSRFDVDKSIREQFNMLRVVDNVRYPAFFEIAGERYILKIEKANQNTAEG